MPTDNLTPGAITTLGALRPGDVGEWLGTGERFLVTERNRYTAIRYAEAYCVGRGDEQVRYLGPGRIEPPRIVMDNEHDTLSALSELEAWKVSQLKVESEWDEQAVGRLLGVPLSKSIRAAIQPGIEKLQQRVAELEGQTKHFEAVVKLLSKEVLRLGGHDIEQIKREVANRKQRKGK